MTKVKFTKRHDKPLLDGSRLQIWDAERGVGIHTAIFCSMEAASSPPDPMDFTLCLDAKIAGPVITSVNELKAQGYLNKSVQISCNYVEKLTRDSIAIKHWLNPEARNFLGEYIWEEWTEEYWQEISDNEIAAMAYSVLRDLCEGGELMSIPWHCARIVYEFFANESLSQESSFLIGVLWGQLSAIAGEKGIRFGVPPEGLKKAGDSSSRKKQARRAALLEELEAIKRDNPDLRYFTGDQMLDPALRRAMDKDPDLWSVGSGQAPQYLKDLKLGDAGRGLQERYFNIFPKERPQTP